MFPSLSSRIAALGTIVILALLALAGMLIAASVQTRQSFHWVTHSADVLGTMSEALSELRDAESAQRGFVITRNPLFAQSLEERLAGSRREIAQVVALTSDNPVQNVRAREIQALVDERIAVMREPLKLAEAGDFAGAVAMVSAGRGRELMAAFTARSQGFLAEERALQGTRIETAGRRLDWVKELAIVGVPIIALLVAFVSFLIVRGIKYPLDIMMEAMAKLGDGNRQERITGAMGSREFAGLARGYNAMADHLETAVAEQVDSEHRLQAANEELRRSGDTLRERGEAIELLGGMAHRMQAARTDAELSQIIRVFVPRVLPRFAGALYAHNSSRNLLVPVASWGGIDMDVDGFAPESCWALRRGQSHFVAKPGCEIVCSHVSDDEAIYHCEPLLAGGEVIGVLHLQGRVAGDSRFQLTVLAENIASALVNHRLQRDLREQTIRDPLTSLFNRRYMEEALATEVARSARSGAPLSVVMCDVDHFKRFNDEFGHDAGDLVLQAVATEMRNRFRDGDVVCRYGGEEFTIIAPGTTAAALVNRVEAVRQAINELDVFQAGRRLGATSMSFGIATWADDMERDGSTLIQAADAALYRAKREGRNRAVVDMREAA